MKKIPPFILALMLLAGCTTAPNVDITAEAEAVRNLENQMTVAYQNRDIEKLLSYGTSDILHLSPGVPPETGIEDYRGRIGSQLADTACLWETYSTKIGLIEVSSSGDMAYVWGTDLLQNRTPDGIVDDPAKWVDIWKKINGEWKIVLNIWNR